VLDTTKIRTTFGLNLPRWERGLDAVIGELAERGRQDSR
jgi:dTDP-4-dehydrorhamnose reductase